MDNLTTCTSLITPPSASGGPRLSPDMQTSLVSSCAEAVTSCPSTPTLNKSKKEKLAWKKPKNMPKRPLSAYNLFFQAERQQLMVQVNADQSSYQLKKRQHKRTSGVGFAALARNIAKKWKSLGEKDREPFEVIAREDRRRYRNEIKAWKLQQQQADGNNKNKTTCAPSSKPPIVVDEVYSTGSPVSSPLVQRPMTMDLQPRRVSCDTSPAGPQDVIFNRRLSFFNSSTRKTRLLLQQHMGLRLGAPLQAMTATAHTSASLMGKLAPTMTVMSSLHPTITNFPNTFDAVVTPDKPRRHLVNHDVAAAASQMMLPPCLIQPIEPVDQELEEDEISTNSDDWDELVERIGGDLYERRLGEDGESDDANDTNSFDTLWGDVCSL